MAASVPKTLSTSTLSLKFMQNAHRAKNLATVELEKAQVKDDGEWEVAKEIRDAWGPETEATQSASYEASLIPFLFASGGTQADDADDDEAPVARGRRVFKRGREVLGAEAAEPKPVTTDTTSSKAKKRPTTGRGATISDTKGKGKSKETEKEKGKSKGKSAREAVRDSTGVGADLGKLERVLREFEEEMELDGASKPAPAPAAPPVFVKPAGVDAPPPLTTESGGTSEKEKKTKKKGKKRKAEGEPEPEPEAVEAAAGVEEGVVEAVEGSAPSKKKRKKSKVKKEGGEASSSVTPAPSA